MNRFIKKTFNLMQPCLRVLLIFVACLLSYGTAYATNLGLSNVPLDVQEGVAPNILLTVDDSGSMSWSFLPDGVYSSYNDARGASSEFNALYYNPAITYVPGVDSNNASLGNATFTAAWDNGYHQSGAGTCTVNLSTSYKPSWYYGDNCDGTTDKNEYANNAPTGANGAAYYYVYDSTNKTGCTTSDNACYDAVIINDKNKTYTGSADRTDCKNAPSCNYDEEAQNFANWYSYYRKRTLLAKNAAGRAFAQITGNIRAAHQTINTDKTISLFNTFTGTARTNFFSWLYGIPGTYDGTPLRNALINGGNEFTKSGIDSPYAKEPGTTDSPEYSCRQNFQVLLTDGYWNGSIDTQTTPPPPSITNFDNVSHTLPETSLGVSSYTPVAPYMDSNSNFLADYAMYYWATDLRTDSGMKNNVPVFIKDGTSDYDKNGTVNDLDRFWNPVNDPATWQHMVTYTIGLGIQGHLTFNDANYSDPFKDNPSWTRWPGITDPDDPNANPLTYTLYKIDDLWHTAIDSRGHYFQANNPTSLVSAFSDVLNRIQQRIGSSSAPAPSAPSYQKGTKLYQPVYDTSDWHGNLRRYDVTNLTTVEWNVMDILNGQDYNTGRNIITYDPSTSAGIPFRYDQLDTAQQTQLKSVDVVNYIRGDRSNEMSNGGKFRNRSYVLGDIVNSAPVYVGPPDRVFPDGLEDLSKPYSAFAKTYSTRTSIIWLGANDGMLHGFDADTGKEKLAFVPTKVFDNLPDLTLPDYQHKFFVDGSPTERDVYYGGDWHTVLVGGLNNGGQEIYALDITNPAKFTEANASSTVLWEFTDKNDPDLGYTYSTPQVAKTNDTTTSNSGTGKWMVFFGNGYNNTVNDDPNGYCTDNNAATYCPVSSTGDAVLYIVDVKDGSLIAKLDTGVGMAQDPLKLNRPNGLSSVSLVDADGNYTVDYVYAGDLFGNLWKFDVTNKDPSKWTVMQDANKVNAPIFKATDDKGNPQPITTAPVIGAHATQAGFMINFGTGKYLELSDLADTSLQTFYGIWDRNEAVINTIERKHTQAQSILQTITTPFSGSNYSARITSNNEVNWYTGTGLPTSGTDFLGWHLDLEDEMKNQVGERVITDPQRRSSRIVFVTNTPSTNPCSAGGSSWIMELDATTGKRLGSSPFDYNNDGVVDAADIIQAGIDINGDGVINSADLAAGSGIQEQGGGKLSRPTILLDSNNNEVKISSTGTASATSFLERGDQYKVNRRAWQELTP